MQVDFLIVGAGLTGLTLAERLSNELSASCLVVDRRDHLGGNACDEMDEHGILIPRYGLHWFRADNPEVGDYLGRFTGWRKTASQILSCAQGRYGRFPGDQAAYESVVGREVTAEEFAAFLERVGAPASGPVDPANAAPASGEIIQTFPADGYGAMFRRLYAACSRTTLLLNADYRQVRPHVTCRKLIYTGAIDEFYAFRSGVLPYRGRRFETEHFTAAQLAEREAITGRAGFWQPALEVNYPADADRIRSIEMKHATGQAGEGTTVVHEYACDYERGGEADRPIHTAESRRLFDTYAALAAQDSSIHFAGRLGTYRDLTPDQMVAGALSLSRQIKREWQDGLLRVA